MTIELTVKALNPLIEEEVLVSNGKSDFIVFANICPYKIEVGKKYRVNLNLVFLDDLKFDEIDEPIEKIERIDEGFSYRLAGKLQGESFCLKDIEFECDDFEGMEYLNGKWIEVEVDRISAEFV